MFLRDKLIQVDIDNKKTPLGWVWYYLTKIALSSYYYNYNIIGIYKTKHGWHARLLPNRQLSKNQILKLRAVLGDDPERLYQDEMVKSDYEFNTLFSWKNGFTEKLGG